MISRVLSHVQINCGYWLIRIPKSFDSKPKFHFGQKVKCQYLDEKGVLVINKGVVVGIDYNPDYSSDSGWHYPVIWTYIPENPRCEGTDGGCPGMTESELTEDE